MWIYICDYITRLLPLSFVSRSFLVLLWYSFLIFLLSFRLFWWYCLKYPKVLVIVLFCERSDYHYYYLHTYVHNDIYIYIYISKVKLATIVEGDPKAPFSITTTPRCRGGRYSIPRIAPLYPWTVPYNAEC